jgi:hypothetical protein
MINSPARSPEQHWLVAEPSSNPVTLAVALVPPVIVRKGRRSTTCPDVRRERCIPEPDATLVRFLLHFTSLGASEPVGSGGVNPGPGR